MSPEGLQSTQKTDSAMIVFTRHKERQITEMALRELEPPPLHSQAISCKPILI